MKKETEQKLLIFERNICGKYLVRINKLMALAELKPLNNLIN
jgi:hypothetical protein